MDLSVDVSRVMRFQQRHVAVRALLGFRRIVERPRAESRDAAGLPGIVVIETANPPVTVDVRVEVHFMARRAEISRLAADERFQECSTMRFRVHISQEVVERLDHFVVTRRQFGQLRILEREVALSHRAFHSRNGVTHHARKSGVRLGLVDQFAHRRVEHPAEQQGRIMDDRTRCAMVVLQGDPSANQGTATAINEDYL